VDDPLRTIAHQIAEFVAKGWIRKKQSYRRSWWRIPSLLISGLR
jgi:hypothetical protein